MSSKVNNLEQHKRRKFVEIHGVENLKNVNPEEQLAQIQNVIGMSEVCNQNVQRMNTSRSTILLVKVQDEKERNDFIAKAKSWWYNLSVEEKTTTRRLFFNESLIPEYRALFREARIKGKTAGFKYVWVKHGRILIRKPMKVFIV